jgi:3-phosphoshikimate 1-carboxyvinyltransferase
MFNAIADGRAEIKGFLQGEDCLSTVDCLRGLGVDLELDDEGTLVVHGAGLHGLREPDDILNAGNSGTTIRLLVGILAGQPFLSVVTGDSSLRRRPMHDVLSALRDAGAEAWARDQDYPPVAIKGGKLKGIHHELDVESAQLKSGVILASLYAEAESVVEEVMGGTRDHTERMLEAMGLHITSRGLNHWITPPERLRATDFAIPRDMSSAAFWLVAGAAHPDAEILLPAVGVNHTRTGIIDALRDMGADIEVLEERFNGGEPIADIVVRSSELHGTEIEGEAVLRMIDEVPAFAIAAALANGRTVISDASRLRVKETDRIATVVRMLRAFGAEVEELPDGLVIEGRGSLTGGEVSSDGDHRLAMAMAVAGLMADGETVIDRAEVVDVSYPGFWRELDALAGAELVSG